ncbi:MAG: HD domain-containing phosphohydrolase [Candidatus Sericytochromatia bacterium]|nr:HD domain-containing phosphohydrolase [Candidatus Sericytochromatia bacterium]MEB3221434.1 HD domain-containing phosphohydrolase [Candidatus Sericytochromatia bacterium]
MSKKYSILVVDDEPDNLLLLERVLRREYNVFSANSGAEALEFLEGMDVDMIISDQRMPNMTGAELLGSAYLRNPDQVRILLTAYSDVKDIIQAINAGHIYQYIAKPWDPDELKLVVRRSLESYQLTLDNRRMLAEYRNDEAMVLSAFSNIVGSLERRVPARRGRAARVKDYASALARELRLFGEEMTQLEAAAHLYQLGTLVLPDAVLNTPEDALDADGREALAAAEGATEELLLPLPFFVKATPICGLLAERYDGSGPRGMSGASIPQLARILHVAIAFEEATSGVGGSSTEGALASLAAMKGTRLDPELVDQFAALLAANPDLASCLS